MGRYQFNRDQLRFMEVGRDIKGVVQKMGMGIVVSLVLAVVYYFLFSSFFDTPEERQLLREQKMISQEYEIVKKKMAELDLVVGNLEERDRDIYRTLFKSDPPDIWLETESSIALDRALTSAEYFDLVHQTEDIYKRLDQKTTRINRLFREIAASITPEKIASIPNLIPLQELEIHRVGATVGERIHPFYKTIRMHTGLDYIAALGTNVLAPADGVVTNVAFSKEAGNTVSITHDFGYRTVYEHLGSDDIGGINNGIFVHKGQKVTKGMIIGRTGNSGLSLAPHLHYEVWKGDKMMNPIHFCFSQVSPAEYKQMMVISYNSGQSLD